MKGKYISGFLVVLTFVFSLFGSGGQAHAATFVGGASLSKYWYVEPNETYDLRYHNDPAITEKMFWTSLDSYMYGRMSDPNRIGVNDYYHVFVRRVFLNNDYSYQNGRDEHLFFAALQNKNSEIELKGGYVYFKDKTTGAYLTYDKLQDGSPVGTDPNFNWIRLQGTVGNAWQYAVQSDYLKVITVVDKITPTTSYDPNNPPAYAVPGYTSPEDSTTGPTNPTNPNNPDGMPTRPQPPDDNWDLVGWFKYLVDWVVYIFDTFVWLIAELGGKIGELVTQSDGMVSMLTSFFSFLPPEITTLMGIGIITIIILTVFRK